MIRRLAGSFLVTLALALAFAGSSYGQSAVAQDHNSPLRGVEAGKVPLAPAPHGPPPVGARGLHAGPALSSKQDTLSSMQGVSDWRGYSPPSTTAQAPRTPAERRGSHAVAPVSGHPVQGVHQVNGAKPARLSAGAPAPAPGQRNQWADQTPVMTAAGGSRIKPGLWEVKPGVREVKPGVLEVKPGLREDGRTPRLSSQSQDTDPRVASWDAFDGADSDSTPAGPTIAVGPNAILAAVNAMVGVFDKQGRPTVAGPHISLDDWFKDILAPLNTDFAVLGPQAVYDPVDKRYILAAIANNLEQKLSLLVFSVSESDDPSGGWCDYVVEPSQTGPDRLPLMMEHMTAAVNRDAITFAGSLYDVVDAGPGTSFGFDHSRAFFLAKSVYYRQGGVCAPVAEQQWTRWTLTDDLGEEAEYVRAASNLDGTDAVYLASTVADGGDTIKVWSGRTHARDAAPLTGDLSVEAVSVDPYDMPPDADQRGTSEPIATSNARLTSAVYRDHQLWLAHTVACVPDDNRACYKWYAGDPAAPDAGESGFWGLTGGHYFMPAVMPDGNGEPVVLQNFSSSSTFVSVGFGDGRGEAYEFLPGRPGVGTACYDDQRGDPSSVWGFMSGMALDPVRGTVWGHAAYAGGSSAGNCESNDWKTVVFEVDWPNRPSAGGITGTVYFKGNPEDGAELDLVESDGQNTTTVATTTTEADGSYAFTGAPTLPGGRVYYVAYTNPLAGSGSSQDNDRLLTWLSHSIRSYRAGESADGGSFDIADVELVAPEASAVVPYGTSFRWQLRTGAYRAADDKFYLRWSEWDPQSTLGYTGPTPNSSLRIDRAALPAAMSPGTRYGWSIRICRDPDCDEVGLALWRRGVTFETNAPTATPPPTSDNWRIGVPIVANREFRGVFAGGGRYVERRGSISNRANSAVQIQNLDGNNTLNAATWYVEQPDPYLGDPSVPPRQHRVDLRNVAAGGASNMYLPSLNLPSGLFSAAIESDGPTLTAAIARTDWSTGGAGIFSNVAFSDRLVVPLIVRNYYGLSSIVSVMADGPTATKARVEFFRSGDSSPLAGPSYTISPWAAVTFDLNDAAAEYDRLGDGFLGAAVITVEGSGRVGAASLVYSETNPLAVSAFEAIPATSASDTLYVPLFRSRQRGVAPQDKLDTGISVFNPLNTAAAVTVTYYPTESASASTACRSQRTYTHGPVRVEANSSYVFYQGPGGGHGLPDDCFGSAVVRTSRSSEKVLAIVNDSTNLSQLTAAYNATSSTEAHTKVAVPLFRNKHLAQLFTTGIQVMNAGTGRARVEISFTRVEGPNSVPITGCGDDCLTLIDPNRSYTWYPPAIGAISAGAYGSAIVKSDEPVVVIVNDYPLAGGVDAAIYNGIPVVDQPVPGASGLAGRPGRE